MKKLLRDIALGLYSGGGLPAISVSPSSLNFGSIPVGSPATIEVEIENTGDGALEITLPITSDNAAFTITVPPPVTSLAPGASTTFTAQYSGALPQAYSGNISIVSNAASSPTVIAVTATSDYATRFLATNPIQLLKFNEASGIVAEDSTANNYDGAYTGATLQQGSPPMGGAGILLDGLNDIVNLIASGAPAAMNLNEGSIGVWINIPAATLGGTTRKDIFHFVGTVGNEFRISVALGGGANEIGISRLANGVTTTVVATGLGALADTWIFVMMDFSVVGDYLKMYINGVQVGTTQTGNLTSVAGSPSVCLYGANGVGFSNAINCYLSYAGIWNAASNATRIGLGVV